jgi:tetratricopeptide (TPR) repeat protein
MNFYSLYRIHNYHFKLYGAMFLGNYAAAMDAVAGISETIPDELLRMESPPMADFIEGYMGMKTHVLVRFGKWNELIADPLPEDTELYCTTAAINCYGKGIACAATGEHAAARQALADFEKHAANVSEERYVHVVSCRDILGVAREMLKGEMEYHQGNYDVAFSHLRQAVANEDALPYDEPWGWMMPSRHALGALLLEQGHVEQAMATYEADLGLDDSVIRSNQHPDNVWALLGLYECYERLGRQRDARALKPRRDISLARSDLKIKASCFCSLGS